MFPSPPRNRFVSTKPRLRPAPPPTTGAQYAAAAENAVKSGRRMSDALMAASTSSQLKKSTSGTGHPDGQPGGAEGETNKAFSEARKAEADRLAKLRDRNTKLLEAKRKEEEMTLRNKRAAEERRRREEAEIRIMIHAEIEKGKVYQARIAQNELQLAQLAKQVENIRERHEIERVQMNGEVRVWKRRVEAQRMARDAKASQLKELQTTAERLRILQGQSRLTLTAHFLREDMRPDFTCDPAEIFSEASMGGVSKEVAQSLDLARRARDRALMTDGVDLDEDDLGEGDVRDSDDEFDSMDDDEESEDYSDEEDDESELDISEEEMGLLSPEELDERRAEKRRARRRKRRAIARKKRGSLFCARSHYVPGLEHIAEALEEVRVTTDAERLQHTAPVRIALEALRDEIDALSAPQTSSILRSVGGAASGGSSRKGKSLTTLQESGPGSPATPARRRVTKFADEVEIHGGSSTSSSGGSTPSGESLNSSNHAADRKSLSADKENTNSVDDDEGRTPLQLNLAAETPQLPDFGDSTGSPVGSNLPPSNQGESQSPAAVSLPIPSLPVA